MRTLAKVSATVSNDDTYTVQDHEDESRRFTGLSFDGAMAYVYAMHGTYTVTNERNNVSSTYIYR